MATEVDEKEDTSAATEQLATNADSQIPMRDRLRIDWEEIKNEGSDDPTGRWLVKIAGTGQFELLEQPGEGDAEGEIFYHAALLKKPQDELQSAIAVGLKNLVGRAFRSKWLELNPQPERERAGRETLSAKNAKLLSENEQLKIVQVELRAALKEKRDVNVAALREQGVNPADFGIDDPNE